MLNLTQKRIEAGKMGDIDIKALYRLIYHNAYGKTMQNLRNLIDERLTSNEKRLFKIEIKTKLYVTKNL